MHLTKSVRVGENELVLETGKLAKQADGAVTVRYGDTIILVTAVSAKEKKDVDFLPLTVEYQEKLYSAGRIPGSYFRREGRLTEKETLTSRLVDRSCRPLFPEGYAYETQIIAGVISSDAENEGDVHGITGASAALMVSDIPFNGPIAGIRVGRVGGQLIANPTAKQREQSDLDLVMAPLSPEAPRSTPGCRRRRRRAPRSRRSDRPRRSGSSARCSSCRARRRPGWSGSRRRRRRLPCVRH